MEYLYFVGIVAAVALILLAIWHVTSQRNLWIFGNRQNDLKEDPIPPFRKTVSGLSDKELEQIEFQDRIDAWQKGYEVRRSQFNSTFRSLEGEKYTYEPPKKSRTAAKAQRPNVPRLPRQFELLN